MRRDPPYTAALVFLLQNEAENLSRRVGVTQNVVFLEPCFDFFLLSVYCLFNRNIYSLIVQAFRVVMLAAITIFVSGATYDEYGPSDARGWFHKLVVNSYKISFLFIVSFYSRFFLFCFPYQFSNCFVNSLIHYLTVHRCFSMIARQNRIEDCSNIKSNFMV